MTLSILMFVIILLVFTFTVIGSWIYTRNCLKNNYLSFKNLDQTLIKKYNLLDYCLINKNNYLVSTISFNVFLFLFDYCLLIISFLVIKNESNSLFIASIIFIAIANFICLAINLSIAFVLYRKQYSNKKEEIALNLSEFITKLNTYKYVEVDEFKKTDIYNFMDNFYQKRLNKSLSKLKFKSNDQWLIMHYIIFLKSSHYYIFNLKNSNIDYTNSNFYNICDQTLNNLMLKISNNYKV